jgi:hypothetical protein
VNHLPGFIAFSIFCVTAAVSQADNPNVLLICVDDLRPELKSFGAEYIHSPNMPTEGGHFTGITSKHPHVVPLVTPC